MYKPITAHEEEFEVCGLSFHCIYGLYINGAWCAIVNWDVCAQLSGHNDASYNSNKIYQALCNSPDAAWLPHDNKAREAIAYAIGKTVTERIEGMKES